MNRYRLEICKGEEVRFVSHLELMKAFERALRRAEVPVAFSEGFNPHPKISFGSALPVGVTSSCELVDVELKEKISEGELQRMLEQALPPGIRVNQVAFVEQQGPALMAQLNRADYNVRVPLEEGRAIEERDVQSALEEFLKCNSIVVTKRTKKGIGEVDIRPGVFDLTGHLDGTVVEFEMSLQTGSKGNIRAEDVLAGLAQLGLATEKKYAKVHRTRLYAAG